MTTHTDHWLCSVGDTLADPAYFSPPPSGTNGAHSLRVVAFHATLPRSGWTFERAAKGQPWTRTA